SPRIEEFKPRNTRTTRKEDKDNRRRQSLLFLDSLLLPSFVFFVYFVVNVLLVEKRMADSPAFDKAQLAWNLPWDADWVTAVAWLGPSRRIAAGNRLGDILIWELPEKPGGEAPKPTRKLSGHTNSINRLIASKDGNRLYSCSHDHTIRVWDLKAQTKGEETSALNAVTRDQIKKRSGKVPAPIEAKVAIQSAATEYKCHSEWVVSMVLSRDEKLLVSGDDNGLVLVQDAASGKEVGRLKVKGWVYS